MGYEPCPVCAAITTDQTKHAADHESLATTLAYLLATVPPVATGGLSPRSWSGPDVTPLPDAPSPDEKTRAAGLRGQAEAAFQAFDTAMASLTAFKEIVQQAQPTQGQVNDQVYSLTVILEGVLRASNGLARLALRRFDEENL